MDTGAGELILSLVMGAFCGLVLGMIVSNVLRYCSMVMGRNIGGHSWAIYCAILGAALFAWWSVNDEE